MRSFAQRPLYHLRFWLAGPLHTSLLPCSAADVSTGPRHYCSSHDADKNAINNQKTDVKEKIERACSEKEPLTTNVLVKMLQQIRTDYQHIIHPINVNSHFYNFGHFERNVDSCQENKIGLIPGGKGIGRTTLLRALIHHLDEMGIPPPHYEYYEVPDVVTRAKGAKSLYLSDAIVYDATDPRLSFGDSSFIKLQYRVLHAATGAPPHAFGTTVLELRQRLGLEAWFAFPNDMLFAAVRELFGMTSKQYLLIAVDDVHAPGQSRRNPQCLDVSDSQKQCPDATNSIEDLHRLLNSIYKDVRKRWKYNFIVGVASSQFIDWQGKKTYLITVPPPNPNPLINAACESLCLNPDSQRAREVQYMMRHAAVNARFLADTYHLICGGGLTSVADFDAKFNAFVSPRIDQFLAYCREKHLDPKRLFDDIFVADPGSHIIDPLTVAADTLGLCTIILSEGSQTPHFISVHPKIFLMIRTAFYHTPPRKQDNPVPTGARFRDDSVHHDENTCRRHEPDLLVTQYKPETGPNACDNKDPSATPSPRSTMISILLALARRVNNFFDLAGVGPSSPARCRLHLQSDVALLMLIAGLARSANGARFFSPKYRLADLIQTAGWIHGVAEESTAFLKDAFVRCLDPAHTSYAAMLASHTLAQGDGPLLVEGMPRAVYSFPRFDDACGLLADPSTAPALLRSMAAHGLIRGALHGLDVRWDVNHQLRGSLTLGLQAIGAATAKRTAAAITEHRARRAEWAKVFKNATEQGDNASSHEKTTAAADFLATNVFVHVFFVDVTDGGRLELKPERFSIGGVHCFEFMISKAQLEKQWPLAARIECNSIL